MGQQTASEHWPQSPTDLSQPPDPQCGMRTVDRSMCPAGVDTSTGTEDEVLHMSPSMTELDEELFIRRKETVGPTSSSANVLPLKKIVLTADKHITGMMRDNNSNDQRSNKRKKNSHNNDAHNDNGNNSHDKKVVNLLYNMTSPSYNIKFTDGTEDGEQELVQHHTISLDCAPPKKSPTMKAPITGNDVGVSVSVGSSAVAVAEEGEFEGRPSPLRLVALLVLFLFLYVGAEVGFGAWIAVVVLREDLAGETGAALMARYEA